VYRCARCGKPLRTDLTVMELECNCGSKIFYKERPNVKKVVMSTGTVKWFNEEKGFGFITPDGGGQDLFVHHTGIRSNGGRATLNDGQTVEYEVGQGQKGPCANKVVPI